MRVYETSYETKRGSKRVPQIKISNEKLNKAGFQIGKKFKITYSRNIIVLKIIEGQEVKY